MTDPLQSARIKLQRANLHAGIARREARRFFKRHPEPTFAIQPDGEERMLNLGDVFRCKIVITRGWPDLPDSFSARFGDAIHNYRCVLDHIAWQLVCHGLSPPSTLDERARILIQFPFYTAEESFDKSFSRRLPGVDPKVIDYIKMLHIYVGGQATNDALTALVRLSNDDKHRTLTVIASTFLNVQGDITLTNCDLVRYRNPPMPLAVKNDAVVTRLECRVTGAKPNVGMNFQPTLHIALEDGTGFGDVLAHIGSEVAEILNSPEVRAAVS